MKDQDRVEVLLEDMNGKFDTVLELVKEVPEMNQRLIRVEAGVDRLEDRMGIVEGVLKVHSEEIAELKQR